MRGLIINHDSRFSGELSKLFDKCDIVYYTHFNIEHAMQYDYVVLSGGDIHISDDEDITLEKFFLKTCNKPIFAVCLGMQIMSIIEGEKLKELNIKKIGKESLTFQGIQGDMEYNHGWFIENIPSGYEGIVNDGIVKAIYNDKNKVMGFQGHPELSSQYGMDLRDLFFRKYLTNLHIP